MSTRSLAWIALGSAMVACAPVHVDTSSAVPDEGPCVAGWVDAEAGLCWQPEARDEPLVWSAARDYCEELHLGGHEDWRLPTIDELRSLVRGCPDSERGGACQVTHGSGMADWSIGDCVGCPYHRGHGEGGAYWDAAVMGPTNRGYWTSSEVRGRLGESWSITSHDAFVVREAQSSSDHHVRCVRDGPSH